jgi:hypothetical protein
MTPAGIGRRHLLIGAAALTASTRFQHAIASSDIHPLAPQDKPMTTLTMTKTAPPHWLLAFWKEIDDKTFGSGFDVFHEDATCRLGVAEWNGRETIRNSLRAFIDKGFTAHHDVTEYWDGGTLKVFRGLVTMTFDDPAMKTVKPVMTHFFYMDDKDPSKVRSWIGSVGPTAF